MQQIVDSVLLAARASWSDLPAVGMLWLAIGLLGTLALQYAAGRMRPSSRGASEWHVQALGGEASVLPVFIAIYCSAVLFASEAHSAARAIATSGLVAGTLMWGATRFSMVGIVLVKTRCRRLIVWIASSLAALGWAGLELVIASKLGEAVRYRNRLCSSGRWDERLPFLNGTLLVQSPGAAQVALLVLVGVAIVGALAVRRRIRVSDVAGSGVPMTLTLVVFIGWVVLTGVQISVGSALWRCS